MTLKMSNAVAAFIIFATMAGLWGILYDDLQDNYGFTSDDLKDGKTLIEHLRELQLIEGLNSFFDGLTKINPPTASSADILGGLLSIGTGIIKTGMGIITFIPQIIGKILLFYELPITIVTFVELMGTLYITFILINTFTGREN